ncbi:MAG: DoxX-like family protein [Candidatus Limnocylindrales bacterium]
MSIYVEALIHASMDAVWAHTQTPDLHQRWDLRFTSIEYLPRLSETEPQRFRYTTRLGLGLVISGDGETIGERDLADGSRTSALRFSSAHPLSIIGKGSGYWKYVPTSDGIRFFTSYDYRPRFGPAGAVIDRLVFRPLLGWATAWSFDRLRRWLEDGISPERSFRQAALHALTRLSLAGIFVYEGLVPKLLGRNTDEVAMLHNIGVPSANVPLALVAFGLAEVGLAAALLLLWHRRVPAVLCIAFAVATTVGVAVTSPGYLGGAFNPLTLNAAVGTLAGIDLLTLDELTSAGRGRRRPLGTAAA